jgi:uncharacterized protein (UPF0261 family)
MSHRKAEFVRAYYEDYCRKIDPNEEAGTIISDMVADLLHLAEAEGAFVVPEDGMDVLLDRSMANYLYERANPDE